MTRVAVRSAIGAFLSPPNVAGLQTVYVQPPKVTAEQQFYVNEAFGTGTGAIAYLYLDESVEHRIALGGMRSGRKWRQYTAHLLVFLRSTKLLAQDVGDDNDALLDNLVARMESDRRFGAPTVIFQAGEGGESGGDDIRVRSGLPVVLKGQITQVMSTVTFEVVEILST